MFKFSILLCFLSFTVFGQKQILESILDDKPFDITEAEFKLKWAKDHKIENGRYKKDYDFLGIKNQFVIFNHRQGFLSSIKIQFNREDSNFRNDVLLAFNKLEDHYGKPTSYEIMNNFTVNAYWEQKNFYVYAKANLVSTGLTYYNDCEIVFQKHKPSFYDHRDAGTPKNLIDKLKNIIYTNLETKKIYSDAEIPLITQNLRAEKLPPFTPGPKTKSNYSKLSQNYKIRLSPLNIFSELSYFGHKKNKMEGDYSVIYSENGYAQELKNIEGNRTKENFLFKYNPDSSLKFIQHNYEGGIDFYWIDYDQFGYLSRVLHFINYELHNSYLIYANEKYKNYVVFEYNSSNTLGNFTMVLGKNSLEQSKYGLSSFGNNSLKNTLSYDYFRQHNHPLPNTKKLMNFKPVNPYDSSVLYNIFILYKTIVDSTEKLFKKRIDQIKGKPFDIKIAFNEPKIDFAEIKSYSGTKMPFKVRQIAPKAAQLIDTRNKLHTVRLNQVILKRFKLSKIIDNGVILQDLKTNKTLEVELNSEITVDKNFILDFNGTHHKVNDNTSFMGYTFSRDKNKNILQNNNAKLIFINDYLVFPKVDVKIGKHTIDNCQCIDDKTLKKFITLPKKPLQQAKKVYTEKEIKDIESGRIDLQYYYDYCTMTLYDYVLKEETDSTTNKKFKYLDDMEIGQFEIVNKSLKLLSSNFPEELIPNFKNNKFI